MTGDEETAIARLLRVMDRLYSPGGDRWNAAQTHETLLPHLLEEAYEYVDAVEDGDRVGMREELGDLLLQVVFHARIASDDPEAPFDLDDLAADVADKLVRRHPGTFGQEDEPADGEEALSAYERAKQEEKHRTSILDGVSRTQPALTRSQKVVARLERAARRPGPRQAGYAAGLAHVGERSTVSRRGERGSLGDRLLALVREAEEADVDLETDLRSSLGRLEGDIRRAEETIPDGRLA